MVNIIAEELDFKRLADLLKKSKAVTWRMCREEHLTKEALHLWLNNMIVFTGHYNVISFLPSGEVRFWLEYG